MCKGREHGLCVAYGSFVFLCCACRMRKLNSHDIARLTRNVAWTIAPHSCSTLPHKRPALFLHIYCTDLSVSCVVATVTITTNRPRGKMLTKLHRGTSCQPHTVFALHFEYLALLYCILPSLQTLSILLFFHGRPSDFRIDWLSHYLILQSASNRTGNTRR